ncbi:hypothetical protein AAMO2058_000962900 [Amorphochlora amoebiformis]
MESKKKEKEAVNVIIETYEGHKIQFKIWKTSKFTKMFTAHHKRLSKDIPTYKYFLHGARIQWDQTPAEIDLSDGDSIDAFVEMSGGGDEI